jgi:hypothetical protein
VRPSLTPIASGLEACASEPTGDSRPYALIYQNRIVALARAMRDCQSAVLACLTWHASRQERLKLGPLAGRFLARLSGAQLAEMAGRPLRTVRHALSRLSKSGVLRRDGGAPGRTAVYELNLSDG